MGQRSNDAAAMDVQTMPSEVVCAGSMEQRLNDAAEMDALIYPYVIECAAGMVHFAILMISHYPISAMLAML